MRVLKGFIPVIILFLSSTTAFSQFGFGFGSMGGGIGVTIPVNNNSRQRSHFIDEEIQKMKKDLALDSSQVVKVRGLLVERDRRMSHKDPMTGKEYDQRIREILNDEQY